MKGLAASAATLAVVMAGSSGTASAACSAANGPDPYDNSGGRVVGTGSNEVFVLGTNYDVGGALTGVGYGEADPNVGTGGADYDGTLASSDPTLGYGDIEGSVTSGGAVSGSADGETADGAISGSGSLSGTTLTVGATVAGQCLP